MVPIHDYKQCMCMDVLILRTKTIESVLNWSISYILSHFNLLYRLICHIPSQVNLLPSTGGRHLLILWTCLLLLVGG